MNVWWCAEDNVANDSNCHAGWHESCGPRRLDAVDALVIVRDENGNWPQWALGVLVNILFVGPVPNWDAAALDALAEAARINLQ